MRPLLFGILCAAVSCGWALAATGSGWVMQQGPNLCLRSDHINRRTVLDNRSILFRMDDGTYWKNTLQHDCPGLKMSDGIKFVARDSYVCGNQQPFALIGRGTTCYLGDFAPAPDPAAH